MISLRQGIASAPEPYPTISYITKGDMTYKVAQSISTHSSQEPDISEIGFQVPRLF